MIKSIKRKIRIVKNFFWFVITAPEYVKVVKYESPGGMATLISILLWGSLAFFIFASIIHKFGNDAGHWYSEFVNNPNLLIGKPFVLSVVLLSFFYLQATIRDLWDIETIKKDLFDFRSETEIKKELEELERKNTSETKKSSGSEWKVLLKPFFFYYFILFIPTTILVRIWLNDEIYTFGLIIFIGAIFSAFSAVLALATLRFTKDFFNPIYGQVEDFRRRNGYYPKTKYHAYAELCLRAIRAFAIFYLITTPFYYGFNHLTAIIGTILVWVFSSMLIKKTRIRSQANN